MMNRNTLCNAVWGGVLLGLLGFQSSAGAESLLAEEGFVTGAAGWQAIPDADLVDGADLGVGGAGDGALVIAFEGGSSGAPPLPRWGGVKADASASAGAFVGDFSQITGLLLRFDFLAESVLPLEMDVLVEAGVERFYGMTVPTTAFQVGQWSTVEVPFVNLAGRAGADSAGVTNQLQDVRSVSITVGNAGSGTIRYRLDNVRLSAGATQGGTDPVDTDEGDSSDADGSNDGADTGTTTPDDGAVDESDQTDGDLADGDQTDSDQGDSGQDGSTGSGDASDADTGGSVGGTDEGSGTDSGADTGADTGADSSGDNNEDAGASDGSDDAADSVTDEGGEDDAEEEAGVWSPANGETVETLQPTFVWPAVASATWYQVELLRDQEMYRQRWVEGSAEWQPEEDLAVGAYTWRVRGWAATNTFLPWSETQAFTVQGESVEGAVTLLGPFGEQTTQQVVYRWEAFPNVHWYHLRIERVDVGIWHDVWHPSFSPFHASAFLTEHPAGIYRWQVRTWTPGELGPWSAPAELIIPESAVTVTNAVRPPYELFRRSRQEWPSFVR